MKGEPGKISVSSRLLPRLMKLSQLERKFLFCAFFHADLPLSQTAKALGVREHRLRYAYERLYAAGIIRREIQINPWALGIKQYQLFFSLLRRSQGASDRFAATIVRSPLVAWAARVGGAFDFDVVLCAHDESQVVSFLNSLSFSLKGSFFHKTVATEIAVAHYLPKYLGDFKSAAESVSYGAGSKVTRLDE